MSGDMAAPEFDPARWRRMIILLSLDVVCPFYERMGLKLHAGNQLQKTLREQVIASRHRSIFALYDELLFKPRLIAEEISEVLSVEDYRHFLWWQRNIFGDEPRDHQNLNKWNNVLQTCRHERQLWARLGFPAQFDAEALKRFLLSGKIKDYEQRQREGKNRALSDWDLHIFALYLFDEDLSPFDPDGPTLWMNPTIRAVQRYEFWAWVLKILSVHEQDRLQEVGRQIAEEEDLYVSAADLPHPSVLDIGL